MNAKYIIEYVILVVAIFDIFIRWDNRKWYMKGFSDGMKDSSNIFNKVFLKMIEDSKTDSKE